MSSPDIEELAEVIGEVVDLSGVELDENTELGDDVAVDSRDMLRVISRLESRYNVSFSPQDVLSIKTLGDLLDVIRRRSGTA